MHVYSSTGVLQEGSQFCKGFGGVGGFLRYRCDFLQHDVFEGMEDKVEDVHQVVTTPRP